MSTRLQDAVISVRIETGQARSQIQQIRADADKQIGSATSPGHTPLGASNPFPQRSQTLGKAPGHSDAPEEYQGAGINRQSPGELGGFNPIGAASDLRDMVTSRTPREMLSAMSGIAEQIPGLGTLGTIGRAAAALPDAAIAAFELAQFIGADGAGEGMKKADRFMSEELGWAYDIASTVGTTFLSGGLWAAGGVLGLGLGLLPYGEDFKKMVNSKIIGPISETRGMLPYALGQIDPKHSNYRASLANNRGEWAAGPKDPGWGADMQFETNQKVTDKIISGLVAVDEAFSETRTVFGMTAVVGSKAYKWDSFMSHLDRFADVQEFQYRFARRNTRAFKMQAGTSMAMELPETWAEAWKSFHGTYKKRLD